MKNPLTNMSEGFALLSGPVGISYALPFGHAPGQNAKALALQDLFLFCTYAFESKASNASMQK